MAVNAELYLRSSSARRRALSTPGDAHTAFGFMASADGLPITVTELTADGGLVGAESLAATAPTPTVTPMPTPAVALSPTTTAPWLHVLPELEDELGTELRAFRKRMLASRVPADYVSEMFAGRRSGAWAIYRDIRTVEGQGDVEFSLYVRRGKDQLAVWEGPGTPDSLRANFSRPVPGPPPAADDVRRGLAAALVRHRISVYG
ncbi:MAG: hypothetical protein Q7T55_13100 [Solirubrobacteraceae bacterium]|nr:hypothetical protein [Solirubrobacteraceae bacterium]